MTAEFLGKDIMRLGAAEKSSIGVSLQESSFIEGVRVKDVVRLHEMGYAVNPDLFSRQVSLTTNGHGAPTPAKLSDRILQDIRDNPDTTISAIRERLSINQSPRTVQRILKDLIDDGSILAKGQNRGRKYRPK